MKSMSRPLVFVATLAAVRVASAQCVDWSRGFDVPGVTGSVEAVCEYDDGNGPALYVGGSFSAVGAQPASSLARFDGASWSTSGLEVDGNLDVLAVFDDGSGPKLYAGGNFSSIGGVSAGSIARFDGHAWSPLGTTSPNGDVRSMAYFDDGSGPKLYVGGRFSNLGSVTASRIARFDGVTWSQVGAGLSGTSANVVSKLTVFDDGSGAKLYAGGAFQTSAGVPMPAIACWDGSIWSSVGGGLPSFAEVLDLCVYDDGSGPGLYAGGVFQTAGGNPAQNIARWDGTTWSALGSGLTFGTTALAVFDDGAGAALYAAGPFALAGGQTASGFARWQGSTWTPLPGGFLVNSNQLRTLASASFGGVTSLVIGGNFDSAGPTPAENIAIWRNSTWSALGTGNGFDAPVHALHVHDDGSGAGPRLYAGGVFQLDGAGTANSVAVWNGSAWAALGAGIDPGGFAFEGVRAFATHDDGNGPALYAGGFFFDTAGSAARNVAKWDGTSWSAVGNAPDEIYALASWDDGSGLHLYAGGYFTFVEGQPGTGIARFDGTQWSLVGGGFGGAVQALLVHDDGTGSALYVGGSNGAQGRVSKWNGQSWTDIGAGPLRLATSLAFFDDGSGTKLYAGGDRFTSNTACVARFDGNVWTSLGIDPADEAQKVLALAVFDDGFGPALYACGFFPRANGFPVHHIARWRGSHWSELSTGANARVDAMAVFDGALYAGGVFTEMGDKPSRRVARMRGAHTIGRPLCFGDGEDAHVSVPCPCGNTGMKRHGCANERYAGVQLCATDSAVPSSVQFTATGISTNSLTLLFSGGAVQPGGAVFGDGVLCIGGPLRRVSAKFANNERASVTHVVPGDSPGTTTHYQMYYRSVLASFCPPGTFNVTNAVRIAW